MQFTVQSRCVECGDWFPIVITTGPDGVDTDSSVMKAHVEVAHDGQLPSVMEP